MIDFNNTSGTELMVEFRNSEGQILKHYPLTELEDYAISECLDLDTYWYGVTEKFYNFKNPEPFKSGNSIYPYGKQGLYNISKN